MVVVRFAALVLISALAFQTADGLTLHPQNLELLASDDTAADASQEKSEEAAAMQLAYFNDIYGEVSGEVTPLADLKVPSLLRTGSKNGTFCDVGCSVWYDTHIPRVPSWMGERMGKPDYLRVAKKVKLAQNLDLKTRHRVACLVYSYREHRQMMRDSYATWGQDCDVFLPFSDEAFDDTVAGYKTIEVHPASGDEKDLIGKLRAAFNVVNEKVKSGEIHFDFLTVSGDDSFFIMPNLRNYLSEDSMVREKQANGEAIYMGRRLAQNTKAVEQSTFASGAGYVLNMKAVDIFVNQTYKGRYTTHVSGWWEDVFIADALYGYGVKAMPTEDGNAQRFHTFDVPIASHENYETEQAWVKSYTLPFPRANRMNGISSESILFHYEKGHARYDLHDYLYYENRCVDSNHLALELE